MEALKANRCDYVRVLMDQGVKIKHENLNALFAEVSDYIFICPNLFISSHFLMQLCMFMGVYMNVHL